MMRSANMLLRQAEQQNAASNLNHLTNGSALQVLINAFFTNIVAATNSEQSINLSELAFMQTQILRYLKQNKTLPRLLETLQLQNKLAPVPEVHWLVDRSAADHQERFGFDVFALLQEHLQGKQNTLLLELGSGNGAFFKECKGLATLQLALADKLYYSIKSVIAAGIDFEALGLNASEADILADFLYKILVLTENDLNNEHLEYNQAVMAAIKKDPAMIWRHLASKIKILKQVKSVPDNISHHDEQGQPVYPNRINKPQSGSFSAACDKLMGNFSNYLKPQDVYQSMPAYPVGVMVADLEAIKNLPDASADVIFASRSTVYKTDAEYIDLVVESVHKLRNGAIYIDDSVRDNDGYRYRIKELQAVKKTIKQPIWLIMGTKLPREDKNFAGEIIPRAFVIGDEKELIQKHLNSDGFQIVEIDDDFVTSRYAAIDNQIIS